MNTYKIMPGIENVKKDEVFSVFQIIKGHALNSIGKNFTRQKEAVLHT